MSNVEFNDPNFRIGQTEKVTRLERQSWLVKKGLVSNETVASIILILIFVGLLMLMAIILYKSTISSQEILPPGVPAE